MIKSDSISTMESLRGDLAALERQWAEVQNKIREGNDELRLIKGEITEAHKELDYVRTLKAPLVSQLDKEIQEKTKEVERLREHIKSYESRAEEAKVNFRVHIEKLLASIKNLERKEALHTEELAKLEVRHFNLDNKVGELSRAKEVVTNQLHVAQESLKETMKLEEGIRNREIAVGARENAVRGRERALDLQEQVMDEMYIEIKERYKHGLPQS